jgi:enoyl-CoA hydratase
MTAPATYSDDRIVLDDGKVNAFSVPTLHALLAAIDEARAGCGPLALSGRPGCFSAGFDLKVFGSGDADGVAEMLELGAQVWEQLLAFPRPVVVAAPGHAMAAGAFVLLAADVRIGVDGPYKVGLNEVAIGLTMPWAGLALAEHRLAQPHLQRAVLEATLYTPREAVEVGFLDAVVAPEELDPACASAVERLAGLNADAFAGTKARRNRAVIDAVRAGAQQTSAEIRSAAAGG